MGYKYQRRQIFGKRLKVPKHILNKVYNCTLSFNEFIEYQLDDKIPISCIIESDRRIVEKFGIDKCKVLDWELINKPVYSDRLFDVSQNNDENLRYIINAFNEGKVGLKKIIYNWDLFKDKDLSYCLLKDNVNENHITDAMLKEFMSNYGNLASLIVEYNDIYTFISNIFTLNSEEEKKNLLSNLQMIY